MSVSRSRPCGVNLVEKSNIFISRFFFSPSSSEDFTSAAPDAASWEWERSPRGNDLKESFNLVTHIEENEFSFVEVHEKKICDGGTEVGSWDHAKYPLIL